MPGPGQLLAEIARLAAANGPQIEALSA